MSAFKTGMAVIYVGTTLGTDLYRERGTVCDTAAEAMTTVDFGERGDIIIPDEDLVLAGGQRVGIRSSTIAGTTSDSEHTDQTGAHFTNVIWDDGDVFPSLTASLLPSDEPRNGEQTLRATQGLRAHLLTQVRDAAGQRADRITADIALHDGAIATLERLHAADPARPTAADVQQENAALRKALRSALKQAWHGDDCETGHMVRNAKCNCWRVDAIGLIPDGATYADETEDDK